MEPTEIKWNEITEKYFEAYPENDIMLVVINSPRSAEWASALYIRRQPSNNNFDRIMDNLTAKVNTLEEAKSVAESFYHQYKLNK